MFRSLKRRVLSVVFLLFPVHLARPLVPRPITPAANRRAGGPMAQERLRRRCHIVLLLTLMSLLISLQLSTTTRGQNQVIAVRPDLFTDVPSLLEPHAAALGGRARIPGKERTVFQGRVTRSQGEQAVRVITQLPNLVRLEGFLPGPPLTFDGATRGRNSRAGDELLEMFSADTAEGLLESVRSGAAVQLLGRRFPADPVSGAPAGALYDIYVVSGDVPSNSDPLVRLKEYAFDSTTALLAYTRYADASISPPVNVEVRFSEWTPSEDSFYARRIERWENGSLVLTFVANAISAEPKANPASFR